MGGQRHGLSYEEIRALKRHYRVSAAAFIVRLRDIGIITQATLRYAFQTMAKRWRREEPDPLERAGLPPEELPERFTRLCYRSLAERLISTAKAVELLKMSLAAIEIAMRGPVVADENHC